MRKIFIITERRADYSRFKPILDLIKIDKYLDYDLVVTGMHLMDKHGKTINEIIDDGFRVFKKFEMFLEDEDSGAAMVRSFSEALKNITYCLTESKPDLILSGFDIAANFAVTVAGAHMNIPVAHIQGGEVTGTIDESIRHAMSKFSHYHFAANEDAKERLIKMGERPENVFNVGCPSIDAILQVKDDKNILKKFDLSDQYFLMIQHPVTSEINDAKNQVSKTINAILKSNVEVLIILPNNDAGYSKIFNKIKESKIKFVETLSIKDYVNLLKRSKGLIGNSSSGIHETSTFNIPTINIGTRQNGRLRSDNIIDVDYSEEQIYNAIKKCISIEKIEYEKPYGLGDSSQKIVELIKKIDISGQIIQKQITY
jgi:GDP/UDP-N,N'-diacetylbacillosamine 2-epimerase (hydrolysing)